MVRLIGLEPTRIATPDPKSGASTNFATGAFRVQIYNFLPKKPRMCEFKFGAVADRVVEK